MIRLINLLFVQVCLCLLAVFLVIKMPVLLDLLDILGNLFILINDLYLFIYIFFGGLGWVRLKYMGLGVMVGVGLCFYIEKNFVSEF